MNLQRLFLAACILLGGFGDAVAQWRPGFGVGFGSRAGFNFVPKSSAISGALADFDFKNDRYSGPPLSVSRASTGYIDDLAGNWTVVAANTARRSDKGVLVEEARTNSIRNSAAQGATPGVVGSGGVNPTNWGVFSAGTLSTQLISVTTKNGIDVVRYRISGTTSQSFYVLGFDNVPAVASSGQVWSTSVFAAIVGGGMTNITSIVTQTRQSGGSGLTTEAPMTLTSMLTRQPVPVRTLDAGATGVTGAFALYTGTGVAVDITLEVAWPQLEQGAFATSPIRTTGTAATRAADVITSSLDQPVETLPSGVVVKTVGDGLSYVSRPAPAYISDPDGTWRSVAANTLRRSGSTTLVESAATNEIRNNSAQGTIPGTPGTAPTNWTIATAISGISRQIVGLGTDQGIDYIDVRLFGTAGAAGFPYIAFEPANAIAALTGQSWTSTTFIKLISGTSPAWTQHIRENDSVGTYLNAGSGAGLTPSANWQRLSYTRTLNMGASVARVMPYISFSLNNAQVIDFTVRIGLPQLELGSTATSPIRTTNAAVTRPADVVTRSGTMAGIATPMAPSAGVGNQAIAAVSDGSTSNRITYVRQGADGRLVSNANPPNLGATGPILAPQVRAAVAGAFASADRALSVGGAAASTEATAGDFPAGLNVLQVGMGGGGASHWNGYIERLALLPNRMSNADLQLLSSLSAWDAPFAFGVGTSFPAFASAVDYDFKGDRYYGPALSVSRASTAYIDDAAGNWTQVAANVLRRSNKGALIEEARTNSVRNSAALGAVAGTPGTMPTNWVVGSLAGLTREVVGSGSTGGIEYVDLRFSGTATATYVDLSVESPVVTAAAGQSWSTSAFLALVGGTKTNVTNIQLITYSFPGNTDNASVSAFATIDGTLRRYSASRALTDATITGLSPRIAFSVTNGAAVDFTIRIGWPQLELGAFATSPIRTTGVAATRAADVVTAAGSQLNALTFAGVARPLAPLTVSANQGIAALSDGTGNNRFILYRAGLTGLGSMMASPPTLAASSTGTAMAQDTRSAVAGAASNGERAVTVNGSAAIIQTSAAADPVGLSQYQIGLTGAGTVPLNGYLERLVVYPTRVPNSRLQELSQLSSFGG